jgi:hypothetical protein
MIDIPYPMCYIKVRGGTESGAISGRTASITGKSPEEPIAKPATSVYVYGSLSAHNTVLTGGNQFSRIIMVARATTYKLKHH